MIISFQFSLIKTIHFRISFNFISFEVNNDEWIYLFKSSSSLRSWWWMTMCSSRLRPQRDHKISYWRHGWLLIKKIKVAKRLYTVKRTMSVALLLAWYVSALRQMENLKQKKKKQQILNNLFSTLVIIIIIITQV